MKVARFSHEGAIAFGIIDEEDLVVLKGDPMFSGYQPTGERVALRQARLLAPVIPRSKVIAMTEAFAASVEDLGTAGRREPTFVVKPNTAVAGPGDVIVLPPQSDDVVAAGELAVVIGSLARNVSAEDAGSVIFGYTVANDVTARDLEVLDGTGSRAKAFDSFCPLGPVIDTDFDPAGAEIEGRIAGAVFQSANTALSVYSPAQLVAFASSVFTLLPGDVILTGAPGGSGKLSDGDAVQVEVPGIGVLTNTVRRL